MEIIKSQEEIKKQRKEQTEKEWQSQIESGFAEFNIGKDGLEKIGDFKNLSCGQKLLVLENFKQINLGRIHEEALTQYQKDVSESKFFGRIWKSVSKKYQIAKREKISVAEIQEGGMALHGEILQKLSAGTKELGFEVLADEKGTLEIQYASGFKDLKPGEQEKVKDFNIIANEYAKMPYEWSLKTASKKEQKDFAASLDKYEKAKENILKIKEEKSNGSASSPRDGSTGSPQDPKDALLYTANIDNKVRLNQFFNTHPEVEKELKNIKSPRLWFQAMRNTIAERGIYFGLGFAGRSIGAFALGAIGLPIATAFTAGYISRERAKQTLKERELLARKGKKDASKEAKNFVGAEDSAKKIDFLLNKINGEKNKDVKLELVQKLKARLKYTQEKIDEGLVNFGTTDKRIVNQYNLMDKLNTGNIAAFAEGDPKIRRKLEERLERFLNFKERKISETQKKYLRKQMLYGAGLGVAFYTLGYTAREILAGSESATETIIPPTKGPSVPAPLEEISPTPKIGQEQLLELTTIKKGEGAWHAIERQLDYQLHQNPSKFGLKAEDLHDAAKIKQILDKETMDLLLKNEIIDPEDGIELRISNPGTRVILDGQDIKIVDEHGLPAETYEWPFGKTISEQAPASPEELQESLQGVPETEHLTENMQDISEQALPPGWSDENVEYIDETLPSPEDYVMPFNKIKDYLEHTARIDVEKSSFLDEQFLKTHSVKDVLAREFIGKRDPILGTEIPLEYGSPKWWEILEKERLQFRVEKILKTLPAEERTGARNLSMHHFFGKYLK